jgi:membrane-associated phospholipid phosphatase
MQHRHHDAMNDPTSPPARNLRTRWRRHLGVLDRDLHAARACLPRYAASYRWLLAVAGIAAVFGTLLYWAGGYHAGFAAIHALRRILPPTIWENLTYLGDTAVALFVLLMLARRLPALLWAGTIAALLGSVTVNVLKNLIGALRPPAALDAATLAVIGRVYHNGSFPSGHAVTAFALACTILPLCRGAWSRALLLCAASTIAVTRVIVGVHWPLDLLAGATLGALLSLVAWNLACRWRFGLTPEGHLALVGVNMLACGIALFDAPDYPAARGLQLLLGSLSLGSAVWHYLLLREPHAVRLSNAGPG